MSQSSGAPFAHRALPSDAERRPSRRRTRLATATPDEPRTLKEQMDDLERRLIVAALQRAGGNQRRAAAELGCLPTTLNEKLRRLGIKVTERVSAKAESTVTSRDAAEQAPSAERPDDSTPVLLRDSAGRVRARLALDAANRVRLEFLDAGGGITARFPE